MAGAVSVGARFLITYNQKRFRADNLLSDFGIVVQRPAAFLWYVRNQRGMVTTDTENQK